MHPETQGKDVRPPGKAQACSPSPQRLPSLPCMFPSLRALWEGGQSNQGSETTDKRKICKTSRVPKKTFFQSLAVLALPAALGVGRTALMLDWNRALGGAQGWACGGRCADRGEGRCEPVPLQVEKEPGRSHLPEKHKESAGSAGGEARPLRALGLARGKPPDCLLPLAIHPSPVHPRPGSSHLQPLPETV